MNAKLTSKLCVGGLALVVLGIGTLLNSGCTSEKPAESTSTGSISAAPGQATESARMTFERTSHDFGVRLEGEDIVHRFNFQNKGSATLIIGDLKFTCRCTGAKASRNEIEPGGEGYIDVRLDSDPGHILASVHVQTNDAAASHELKLSANIQPSLRLSPKIVDFGNVQVGTTVQREFTISNLTALSPGGPVLSDFRLDETADELQVRFDEKDEEDSALGQSRKSSLRTLIILQPVETGPKSANITITASAGERVLARHLSVVWNAVGVIEVRPPAGFFSIVQGSDGRSAKVDLIARHSKRFEILSVQSDIEDIRLEVETVSDGIHYSIIAQLGEKPIQNSVAGTVTVVTTDEYQEILNLPLRFMLLKKGPTGAKG